jgi:dTDP-4-amino-4,6-dideoxygalactose transaminase
MLVPYLDVGWQNRALREPILAATARVIESGRVLYGAELEAFEAELAAWFGVKHAIGVASGTDAVEIALRCVGVGPGDKVLCPAFTAVLCANAIEATGADIVLRDVYLLTANADLRDEPVNARAQLAVSMFGTPAPIDTGRAVPVAPIVEDIAHAMGAPTNWASVDNPSRLVGTEGAAGAVSFYPSKNMGALGDGGAIITNNDDINRRARTLRHYGFDGDNVRTRGQNSRLSELQAAYLRIKLPRVHEWNERRRDIAERYDEELDGKVVPVAGRGSVYHCYVVRHPERDRLKAGLEERGIGTQIHYSRAIHQHERWSHLGFAGQFPNAEELARTVLSLPCYPELRDNEQDAVIAAVKELT